MGSCAAIRWGALGAGLAVMLLPAAASAQNPLPASEPASILLLVAALSLLPLLLVMLTCFVKIVVVLYLLRSALGAPQVPPGVVLTGFAVILSAFVMAPTAEQIYQAASPALNQRAGARIFSLQNADALWRAAGEAKGPLKDFLYRHSRPQDRALFQQLALRLRGQAAGIGDQTLQVVIPAFVVGQLTAAFQIGFLLFVPFLVIDLVVANILLALGMNMLSPVAISLPFKLLLFVLIDGWTLLSQGLVQGYI